jgi:glucose-6-phosphate isomerase
VSATLPSELAEAVLPGELADAVARMLARAGEERVAARIWARDATLWGPAGQPEVADRLGWLDAPRVGAEQAEGLRAFAAQAAADGLTDALVLGMGGSSLAPEVLRLSFPAAEGALRLHVLDSTDPGAILAAERALDLERTLFVVSTKSGGTIETLSLFEHFWSLRPEGSQYVAITDPRSSLLDLAADRGFRHAFENDPDIGGRYSALSLFGLVPAALAGIDLGPLLIGAAAAAERCRAEGDDNPGVWLGAALAALAGAGHDKLTFVVDDSIAAFGVWAEQLVAESTGKHGTGILPVADEPLGAPEAYGPDRVLLQLRHETTPDPAVDDAVRAIADAGVPLLVLRTGGPEDLGASFFLAEFATAVAGWGLGINPFDQPDVQAAKDATSRVLEQGVPELADAGDDELRALLAGGPPEYLATLAYLCPAPGADIAAAQLRAAVRDVTRMTTTFGYGPRYLHSTGQLHKGGPPEGRFLVVVHDGPEDVAVPGRPFSFRTLKNAQAAGDLEALRATGRPAAWLRLDGDDPAAALQALAARVKGLL